MNTATLNGRKSHSAYKLLLFRMDGGPLLIFCLRCDVKMPANNNNEVYCMTYFALPQILREIDIYILRETKLLSVFVERDNMDDYCSSP